MINRNQQLIAMQKPSAWLSFWLLFAVYASVRPFNTSSRLAKVWSVIKIQIADIRFNWRIRKRPAERPFIRRVYQCESETHLRAPTITLLTLCSFAFEWVITLNWHNELLGTENVVSRRHIFSMPTNYAFSALDETLIDERTSKRKN